MLRGIRTACFYNVLQRAGGLCLESNSFTLESDMAKFVVNGCISVISHYVDELVASFCAKVDRNCIRTLVSQTIESVVIRFYLFILTCILCIVRSLDEIYVCLVVEAVFIDKCSNLWSYKDWNVNNEVLFWSFVYASRRHWDRSSFAGESIVTASLKLSGILRYSEHENVAESHLVQWSTCKEKKVMRANKERQIFHLKNVGLIYGSEEQFETF